MEPFPASPEPEYRPEGKGPRPASIATAVKLIWVRIALGVIATLLSLTELDTLVELTREGQSGAAQLSEDAARTVVISSLVLGLVINVAVTALLAYFIAKGANWARIVYTVLAAIGILFTVIGIGGQTGILVAVQVIALALSLAVLVFLYRPDSNAYFTKKA